MMRKLIAILLWELKKAVPLFTIAIIFLFNSCTIKKFSDLGNWETKRSTKIEEFSDSQITTMTSPLENPNFEPAAPPSTPPPAVPPSTPPPAAPPSTPPPATPLNPLNHLKTHPLPHAQFQSTHYSADLTQAGMKKAAFVFEMKRPAFTNNYPSMRDLSYGNHIISFDFAGDPVEVGIATQKTPIQSIEVLPKVYGAKTRRIGDRKSVVTINKPGQYYVEINTSSGEKQPLFIFANPKELNIPQANTLGVHYFGPGIHNVGLDYKIQEGQTLYLAPGAYLDGTIYVAGQKNTRIRGRGFISGRNFLEWNQDQYSPKQVDHKFNSGIDYSTNYSGGGDSIEGVTVLTPPGYCYETLDRKNLQMDNIKCLSWGNSTDGVDLSFGGGDIKNSFFKVNDDVMKPFGGGNIADNIVVFKQNNGAVLQLGWGLGDGVKIENVHVKNIHIVRTVPTLELGVRSIVNLAKSFGVYYNNFVVENVTISDNVSSLFGFNGNSTGTYSSNPAARLENFVFKNIVVEGQHEGSWWVNKNEIHFPKNIGDPASSFFYAQNDGSYIRNFSFQNVKINRSCLANANMLANNRVESHGNVYNMNFRCTP